MPDMPSCSQMPDMPSCSNMPDMPNCSNMPECMPSCSKMPDMPSPDNTDEKLSEINLYFVPNLPILETTVVLATPEFVTHYQKLSKCKKANPNIAIYPSNPLELDPEPMDLSFKPTANIENIEISSGNNKHSENFITEPLENLNAEPEISSGNNEHSENFITEPLENFNAEPLENVDVNNETFEISNNNEKENYEISMNPTLKSPLNPENDFSDLMNFENIFDGPVDNDQF